MSSQSNAPSYYNNYSGSGFIPSSPTSGNSSPNPYYGSHFIGGGFGPGAGPAGLPFFAY